MPKRHLFLSYCRDNAKEVRRLHDELIAAGEPVWWDQDLLPGQDWKLDIRQAMRDAYAVVLCLSAETADRITSGIYPEVLDAIATYREYAPGGIFLIPVRLSDCALPLIEIDATRTLDRLQCVDLFPPPNWAPGIQRLVQALRASPHHPLTGSSPSHAPSTAGLTPPVPTQSSSPVRVSIAHLPAAVIHFVGREAELAQLDQAWGDPHTPVLSVVAFGGVGKSALVAAWLERLRSENWRGADYVLGHSFYSQGSRDDAQVSAEGFIDEALQFFGDPNPEVGSAWDKGERLARLVRQHRTLLILDGMEPLQWGATSVEVGRIRDQGLTALVRELAAANPGLCLMTTRQAVADIPTAAKIDLNSLSDQAGAGLLQVLGVQGQPAELAAASRQVQGHGLALRLLGTYLRKAWQGDVRRIGTVDLALVDQRLGGQAWKLVEQYERWLGEGVELSILRLLGLFDRPAEPDSLAAVCAAPAIPGLTDALVGLRSEDWNWAIANLIDYGLLSSDSTTGNGNQHSPTPNFEFRIPNSIDAHPLIREYFATQLTTQHPDATREAHRRLYEHLKQLAPDLPDTLQEMMPLYHAVAHGGQAGLWQTMWDEVLRARIQRQDQFFSFRKLGAMGTDLAALSAFF